ncbi:MAG: SDR family NAD(P)-dependent oxidoreductase [Dehalococcoidia bacterium]|nr:SDR family NAD(P)-dependent oxidoreductase [Dehalococcoidia bacterium]
MGQQCAGHVAIVTGASRGIGQAIAVRLAAEGAAVAVLGRDDTHRNTALAGSLQETLDMVRSVHGRAIALTADFEDPANDTSRIVREAEEAFGLAPDILVHSAAALREFGGDRPTIPFADTPRDWFMRGVLVNVWAHWDLAKSMIPGMRRRGAGWILVLSSNQAAPQPRPPGPNYRGLGGACIYGGTKAFLDRITTGAAQELYADNIAVNSLAPTGPISTPNSRTISTNISRGINLEPMETMVEAALALCTGDPKALTSRVVHSLPFLYEQRRPVRTLDGARLFDGWQPDTDDPRKLRQNYLTGH